MLLNIVGSGSCLFESAFRVAYKRRDDSLQLQAWQVPLCTRALETMKDKLIIATPCTKMTLPPGGAQGWASRAGFANAGFASRSCSALARLRLAHTNVSTAVWNGCADVTAI